MYLFIDLNSNVRNTIHDKICALFKTHTKIFETVFNENAE